MINAEEKLARFSAIILDETKAKAQELIDKANAESSENIVDASDKYYALAEDKIQRECKAISLSNSRAVAAAKLSAQKEILAHRCELTDKVFENVKERLVQFTQSAEYPKYICSLADSCINSNPDSNIEIRLSSADFERRKELFGTRPDNLAIVSDSNMHLGGIKATVSKGNKNIMCDYSFDTALEAQRESFGANSKMTIE